MRRNSKSLDRLQAIILLIVSALLIWLAFSSIALSYPENIRLGYQGCNSCHVSPTGGGALTSYGRTISEEMSTFSTNADGNLFGVFYLPPYLAVGGDTRTLFLQTPPPGPRVTIPMQTDVELAVRLHNDVWVDAAVGQYGLEHKRELRRNYVMWAPNSDLSFRAGHYYAAYGIAEPDHTIVTRKALGFDEGQETYNLEASLHGEWGDVTVTDTFGGDEELTASRAKGYTLRAARPGAAVRAALYLGTRTQVGASYWYHSDDTSDTLATGAFLLAGITRDLYVLSEVDSVRITGTFDPAVPPPGYYSWTELGYEVYRGIHIQLSHEYESGPQRYSVGLQLFPLPHTELRPQARYESGAWTYLLMVHGNW